jgi:hypothetical protein
LVRISQVVAALRDFDPVKVGSGSKAESPFWAVMSASTNCGHHVLALARAQPAARRPDRSGSMDP